jgi:hypothetical protein
MPIIKLPGKTGDTAPAPRRTRAKAAPAAEPATPKRRPGRPKGSGKKTTTPAKRTPKPTAQDNGGGGEQRIAKDGRVLRTPKDLDPKLLSNFESQLTVAGERVKAAKQEHDAAIDAVHEIVVQAQEVGVPMAIIEDVTGISRQWLYKMGQFKGRKADNGDAEEAAPAPKPKRAAAKGSARKSSPAKRATSAANKTAKRGGSSIVKLAG